MATTSGLQPVASIASSLARQNAKGEIVCILCNAPVKSAKVWTAHINGRQHREQIARVKLATQTPAAPQPASSSSSGDRHQFAVPKSMKHDTNGHAMKRKLIHVYEEDVRVKNKMAKMQSQTMSSAVDDDDDDDADEDINTVGPVAEGPMPKENVMEVDDKDSKETSASSQAQKLPQGFFDDNKADKKARGVELEVEKHLDDEYEKFKREVQTVESKRAIEMEGIEEKDDAMRTIDEISTQIEQWRKVNELQERKEQMAVLFGQSAAGAAGNDRSINDEPNSDEEVNVDVLFNWRAKQL